ncbi:MAG: AAA family ATPase [Gammaproteobacteria bacterium]|nr:AAA family ATPase [Gammaproteobacteria bacterium]
MFAKYFGLREPGFSITPDPRYLFLTHEHREALAHLLYGAGEGGGFVLLTGEVGTGKTTICRAFLEQLPENVHVALILNPALTAAELLHTICEEFGIPVADDTTSIRVLLGKLNHYLLEAHASHHRPVLMIDEAQNLSPEVLEQIRLLTNLETHTHKLLQVFLIGQPELRDMLENKRLRQLAQRITARYHLLPLSREETGGYIRHRLAIAGVERPLFTATAINRIHKLSKGVPRLINILCDRALLGAFATHRQQVDGHIVSRAARELQGHSGSGWTREIVLGTALAVLLVVVGGAYLLAFQPFGPQAEVKLAATAPPRIESTPTPAPELARHDPVPTTLGEENRVTSEPAPAVEPVGATRDAATPETPLEPAPQTTAPPPAKAQGELLEPVARTRYLTAPSTRDLALLAMDEPAAISRLLSLWGHWSSANASCTDAEQLGLRCRRGRGDWYRLMAYDRPAVIQLTGDDSLGYAVIAGLDQRDAILVTPEQRVRIPLTALDAFWQGDFLLLWKPPPGGDLLIGPRSPGNYVRWLRETLARIPGWSTLPQERDDYDSELQEAVRRFQQLRGLATDGLVGPETLIHLNTVAALPATPRLEQP